MILRTLIDTAAAAVNLLPLAAAPAASANPTVGQPCTVNDGISPDGTLSCSHQAMMWLTNTPGDKLAVIGQPCPATGDLTYAAGEQIVRCGSGLTWQNR
jgi:hypothetical protein